MLINQIFMKNSLIRCVLYKVAAKAAQGDELHFTHTGNGWQDTLSIQRVLWMATYKTNQQKLFTLSKQDKNAAVYTSAKFLYLLFYEEFSLLA